VSFGLAVAAAGAGAWFAREAYSAAGDMSAAMNDTRYADARAAADGRALAANASFGMAATAVAVGAVLVWLGREQPAGHETQSAAGKRSEPGQQWPGPTPPAGFSGGAKGAEMRTSAWTRAALATALAGCIDIKADGPPPKTGAGVTVDADSRTIGLDPAKVPVLAQACADGQVLGRVAGEWKCVDREPGPKGDTGPGGASVAAEVLAEGDSHCPLGGAKFTADGVETFACNGVTGPRGETGPSGIEGPRGHTGPQGFPGESVVVTTLSPGDEHCPEGGAKFALGGVETYACSGAAGATGPQGSSGDTGAQGIQGIQGLTGTRGNTGPAGPQGPKGDTGAQGSAGESVTGQSVGPDPGHCAQGGVRLTIAGVDGWICNGAMGATGDVGPAGARGDTGPAGPQGDKGDTGPASMAGSFGGDVTGTQSATTVARLNGSPLGDLSSAAAGSVLAYTGSAWSPATAASLALGNLSGSGTAGKLAKFSDAGTVGDSVIRQSEGNVGINTTDPRGMLQIRPNGATILLSADFPTDAYQSYVRSRFGGNILLGNSSEANGSTVVGWANNNPSDHLTLRAVDVGADGVPGDGQFLADIRLGRDSGGLYEARGRISLLTGDNSAFESAENLKERMVVTSSGNVGIGKTNPLTTLNVAGDVWLSGGNRKLILGNGQGIADDGVGNLSLFALQSRAIHLFTGGPGGMTIAPDNGNVGIGTPNPSYPLTVQSDSGDMISWRTSTLQLGRLGYASDGYGGIWLMAQGQVAVAISGNGTAIKPGGGSWSGTSDERLKTNIRPLSGSLDRLLALRGVSFEWKEPEKQGNARGTQIGMVAQEVEKVFPEWVGDGPDGYKVVGFRGFEALAVESLRELRAQNERLEAANERLAAANRSLASRLEALERRAAGSGKPRR